jgi:hypothetical protein
MEELIAHIGGSWRQLQRTKWEFAHANIKLEMLGYLGHGHCSNYEAVIPDTPEARELLHRMKGTISRRQWLRDQQQSKFF